MSHMHPTHQLICTPKACTSCYCSNNHICSSLHTCTHNLTCSVRVLCSKYKSISAFPTIYTLDRSIMCNHIGYTLISYTACLRASHTSNFGTYLGGGGGGGGGGVGYVPFSSPSRFYAQHIIACTTARKYTVYRVAQTLHTKSYTRIRMQKL